MSGVGPATELEPPPRRGGVVLAGGLGRHLVPAERVRKVAPRPAVTPVPGTDFGMALLGGQVVSVIELGGPRDALLLCEAEGQLIALSGIVTERSGLFDAAPGGVVVDREFVADLDIGAVVRSVSQKLGAPAEDERREP